MILALLAACSRLFPSLVEPGEPEPVCSNAAVDRDHLTSEVAWLTSSPRRTETRRAEVRVHLSTALQSEGFTVEERLFEIAGVAGTNLVAHGPEAGRVLVGAHYDSMPTTPGADDNASGVAVLLELARVLGPSRPVTYVWFDAEEVFPGQVGSDDRNFAFGSQAFVDATPGAWDLAVILESVGYSCTKPECQMLPGGVPASFPRDGTGVYLAVNLPSQRNWSDDLAAWQAASTRPAYAVNLPGHGASVQAARFSDHAPFWDAGIDAMLVTDTALLRNPHYHRPSDTPDRIDADLLVAVVQGTRAVVTRATGGCELPPSAPQPP